MNGAHLHLIVNHLPIVGIIIGTLVMIAGFISKKLDIKLTALGIYIFSAITSIIANLTGEEAEEVVEEIAGISHDIIHIHEEHAELFNVLAIILGVISVVTFILHFKKSKWMKYGLIVSLTLSTVLIYVGKLTGTSGGEIRHTEIRKL